jgi:PGF-pre-PGF domain-containing protein
MTILSIQNSLPSFFNVSIVTTPTSANITYQTSQATNTTISLGTNASSLTPAYTDSNFTTNHTAVLTNLSLNSTYYVHILGCNTQTTCNSITTNFTTLQDTTAPDIQNVTAVNITNQSASIQWTTDEMANGSIFLSGSNYSRQLTDSSLQTTHQFSMLNLTANTTHSVTVTTCDASANCANDSVNFTTLETDTFPTIDLVSPANNVTINTSSIVLSCNATDTLNVSTVSFYTNKTGSLLIEQNVSVNSTTASVNITISNLASGTYAWTCSASDSAGQVSVAQNRTFIVDLPPVPPVIIDIDPNDHSSLTYTTTQFTMDITTDIVTECRYADGNITFSNMQPFTSTNSTTHDLDLSNLSQDTTYTLYFTCLDHQTNLTASTMWTFSVDDAPAPSAGGGGGGGGTSASPPTTYTRPFVASVAAPLPQPIQEIVAVIDNTEVVKRVRIMSRNSVASVSVKRLDQNPISQPLDNVQFFLEINVDAITDSAQIDFSLEKGDFDKQGVVLNHFAQEQWKPLPTTLAGADETHYHYTATTPHFSFFAVTVAPRIEPIVATETLGIVIREPPVEYVPLSGFLSLLFITSLVVIFQLKKRSSKRSKKKKN